MTNVIEKKSIEHCKKIAKGRGYASVAYQIKNHFKLDVDDACIKKIASNF